MLGTAIRLPMAWSWPDKPALGRDHQAVRIRIQYFGDQLFADMGAVAICGIYEIDAPFDHALQQREGCGAVPRRAPDTSAGDPHGAETEALNFDVTDADGAGASRARLKLWSAICRLPERAHPGRCPRPSLLTVTGLFQSKAGRITRLDHCGAPKLRFLNSAGKSSIVFYMFKGNVHRLLRAIFRTGNSCIWNAFILFNTQYPSSSQRRPVPSVPSALE